MSAANGASAGAGIPLMVLDTNIWLDYFDPTRVNHDASFELIDSMVAHDVAPLYAVHCAKDVFYIMWASFKRAFRERCEGELSGEQAIAAREGAWSCVEHMDELAVAIGADDSDVHFAQKQKSIHGDFEDDLLIAAVVRCKADLLVTNDETLLRHSPVATMDAVDARKWLAIRMG